MASPFFCGLWSKAQTDLVTVTHLKYPVMTLSLVYIYLKKSMKFLSQKLKYPNQMDVCQVIQPILSHLLYCHFALDSSDTGPLWFHKCSFSSQCLHAPLPFLSQFFLLLQMLTHVSLTLKDLKHWHKFGTEVPSKCSSIILL